LPEVEMQLQGDDPALIAALRTYWTRKRGARAHPGRQDIVPSEIREWLPFVLLVDAVDHGADFRYRLVGSHLNQFFPVPPTGKLMSKALAPFGESTIGRTMDAYRHVMTAGKPLRVKGDGALFGQPPKFFEALLTPLSDDGATVNMIFGGFDFQWNFLAMPKTALNAPDERAWSRALNDSR
jgi:hypothetical protein